MLISNNKQLENLIIPKLKQAVDYVVQKIWNENRELIRILVYEAYDPVMYERTGQFKEAWDTTVNSLGNYIEGEFKYDPRELIVNYDKWQHGSRYTSNGTEYETVMTTYLADIIYQGTAGYMFGEGPWTKKRDAWSALDKWLTNTQFRKLFEEGMNQAGIPWHRNIGGIKVEKQK